MKPLCFSRVREMTVWELSGLSWLHSRGSKHQSL